MLALVTADVTEGLDPDLQPLADDLAERLGPTAVRIVSWDDTAFDWSSLDAAIIRSTWDYTDRLDEFLDWVDRVDRSTRLVNPASIIRWNADKRYLADLARDGIPIAPTTFVEPGHPAPSPSDDGHGPADRISVVKPTVGAGSSGARRCRPDEIAAHVADLHAEGRTAMVQPYLAGLDEHGETALCYVPGPDGSLAFSHAFRKGAILTSTEVEQVGDLFAKEDISGRHPSDAEFELADRVLASKALAAHGTPQFARVDIAPAAPSGRHDASALVVMELELIEPSFYLATSPGSAARLGAALVEALEPTTSGAGS